jgi:hypothetical protein
MRCVDENIDCAERRCCCFNSVVDLLINPDITENGQCDASSVADFACNMEKCVFRAARDNDGGALCSKRKSHPPSAPLPCSRNESHLPV